MAVYTRATLNPAATTNSTLYTAPAGQGVISTLSATNTSTTATAKIRIAHRPLGVALATAHYIEYDYLLQPAGTPGSSYKATLGIGTIATDVIAVYADTANVAFQLWVCENP